MKHVKNLLLIAMIATSFTNAAIAGNPNNRNTKEPIELKWLGNIENKSIFVLEFSDQNKADTYNLIITDENGYEFFNEVIDPSKKTRKFFLNVDELANTKVNFELTSRATGKKTSYQVNLQQTTTNGLTMTKM